jgi:hypothetical protein
VQGVHEISTPRLLNSSPFCLRPFSIPRTLFLNFKTDLFSFLPQTHTTQKTDNTV